MNDKITEIKDQAIEKLNEHFGFNHSDGTYIYNLTRVKSAFHYGTMTMDDFTEVDEEFTAELAELFVEITKPLLQLEETQSKALQEAQQEISVYKAWQPNSWGAAQDLNKCRKALEFYADPANYTFQNETDEEEPELLEEPIMADDGLKAREALRSDNE